MAFKINVAHKGKTYKLEVEAEALIGTKIGDKVAGKDVSPDLEGYELEITGTSDKAGFPGFKNLEGSGLRKDMEDIVIQLGESIPSPGGGIE